MMTETAHVIVSSGACLRKNSNVLIVCGRHNKVFAELLMLESYVVRAYPYLWEFDEKFFLKYSEKLSENAIATLPVHVRSLLENSNVIIWLSQFDNLAKFPVDVGRGLVLFGMPFMV